MINFTIQGGDRVSRSLQNLSREFQERVTYDIHRDAARIVKQELQSLAPEGNNDKKNSSKLKQTVIITKSSLSRSGVFVGFNRKGFHSLFLQHGTARRQTKGNGRRIKKPANRGAIAKTGFVSRAYNQSLPKVVAHISKNYLKIINRSLGGLNRRFVK